MLPVCVYLFVCELCCSFNVVYNSTYFFCCYVYTFYVALMYIHVRVLQWAGCSTPYRWSQLVGRAWLCIKSARNSVACVDYVKGCFVYSCTYFFAFMVILSISVNVRACACVM